MGDSPKIPRVMEFTIPGDPKAKGRGRATVGKGGKARVFTPQQTRDAEDTLKSRAMAWRPEEPWSGPIHLDVIFVLPVSKSWPKWQKEAALAGHFRHTKKPDRDNLLKLLKDAFNGLFWVDDSQIDVGTERKVYGEIPRTWVRMSFEEQLTKEIWLAMKDQDEALSGPGGAGG